MFENPTHKQIDAEVALEYKEKRGFMVEDFREAICDKSLIGYLMSEDKDDFLATHDLSDYEQSLIAGEGDPKINLMIDIDGVLIDTQGEIKTLLKIMTSDWDFVKNVKAAAEVVKSSKIPFSTLKLLLQARDKANKTMLVTDRLGNGPFYFPCLGKKERQILKDHELDLKTDVSKMFASGQESIGEIEKSDITYYIGSSDSDHTHVKSIQEKMAKNEIEKEKLKYLEVRPVGREKNIL